MTRSIRNLVIVLGDQLDAGSAAFDGFDPAQDAVAMAEVREETDYVPQHKARIVLFLAAMRHFRDDLCGKGIDVRYTALDDPANRGSHRAEFARLARQAKPERLIVCEPGDWRAEALAGGSWTRRWRSSTRRASLQPARAGSIRSLPRAGVPHAALAGDLHHGR